MVAGVLPELPVSTGGRGYSQRKGGGPPGIGKGNGRGGGKGGSGAPELQQGMPAPKAERDKQYRQSSRRADAPAPSGAKGHPWAADGVTWASGGGPDDWDNVMMDVREMRELAKFQEMQSAMAQCWPSSETCTSVASFDSIIIAGRPEGGWPADHCKYCKYRARAPPGTPADQTWYYGTGDGAHDAVRCQALKRFIAEGGNAQKFPEAAKHIAAGGLRFGMQYQTKHKSGG